MTDGENGTCGVGDGRTDCGRARSAQGLARYGVTANAIAPGAATRLTATVPADRRVRAEPAEPEGEDPERSPDNIAPVAMYRLADSMKSSFRPAASGLPPSLFASQLGG